MGLRECILAAAMTLPLSGCSSFMWNNNFHESSPGVYRSGLMTESELEETIRVHGFKSVINVADDDDDECSIKERGLCQSLGVQYFTCRLSARRMPRRGELIALFSVFDKAEQPLVVHCVYGADRSGLALAVYKLAYENSSVDEATKQLQFWPYGHISCIRDFDEFFGQYQTYKDNDGPLNFRQWVERVYACPE